MVPERRAPQDPRLTPFHFRLRSEGSGATKAVACFEGMLIRETRNHRKEKRFRVPMGPLHPSRAARALLG